MIYSCFDWLGGLLLIVGLWVYACWLDVAIGVALVVGCFDLWFRLCYCWLWFLGCCGGFVMLDAVGVGVFVCLIVVMYLVGD